MRILSLFAVFTAVAVALPIPRSQPPLMTEVMDIAADGPGELGVLGIDIINLVSSIKDNRDRKRVLKAAAEEARNQVKASEKAEDFSKARKKIEEQTWEEAEEAQRKAGEQARRKAEEEANREHEEEIRRKREADKKKEQKLPSCWKLPGGWKLGGGWDLKGDWNLPPCED